MASAPFPNMLSLLAFPRLILCDGKFVSWLHVFGENNIAVNAGATGSRRLPLLLTDFHAVLTRAASTQSPLGPGALPRSLP